MSFAPWDNDRSTDQGYETMRNISTALQVWSRLRERALPGNQTLRFNMLTLSGGVAGRRSAARARPIAVQHQHVLAADRERQNGRQTERLSGVVSDAIVIVNKEGKIVVSNSYTETTPRLHTAGTGGPDSGHPCARALSQSLLATVRPFTLRTAAIP